jgi:Tetratricopeptide repeat
VSQPLYERYKDALRRGHVAAERGDLETALEAYGEAARLAPDRALPLVAIGLVLARSGKAADALAAVEAALERAPGDESALRARADLLAAAGRRAEAAGTLDRLAATLDGSGRVLDALDVATRALGLAESRSRRAGVRALIARAADDPTAASDPDRDAAIARARIALDGRAGPGPTGDDGDAPSGPAEPEPAAEAAFDPGAATIALEDALVARAGDAPRDLALAAARGHRAGGRLHAAIDACYLALATHPADPALHLALAELYLDVGWRELAVGKLGLLAHLVDLTDDAEMRARMCAVVSERLADESELVARCA